MVRDAGVHSSLACDIGLLEFALWGGRNDLALFQDLQRLSDVRLPRQAEGTA
jgi:hypothetical protein